MESFFQSTLTDLVKSVRSTTLGEAAFLKGALADCKRELRSTDPHIKATALQKVTYIAMLQVSCVCTWVRSTIALLSCAVLCCSCMNNYFCH